MVNLNGATINDGTLTTTSGGTMQNTGSATLNGVTISSNSTVTAANASVTTMQGTITNNGTFLLNSGGNFTDMVISGTVNNTGGGSIAMSDNVNNRIYGSVVSDTLVNDTSNTIQGAGQIGVGTPLTLINQGLIDRQPAQLHNHQPHDCGHQYWHAPRQRWRHAGPDGDRE